MKPLARCAAGLGILLGLVLPGVPALCQVVLENPGIPARETVVYAERTGERTGTIRQQLVLRTEAERSWYEVQYSTAETDVSYRVDSRTMGGFYAEVLDRTNGSLVRRVTEVLASSPAAGKDELVLGDINSYLTSLRGFPFARTKQAKVVFAGSPAAAGGFSLELAVQGRETIRTGGVSRECWKLQFGMSGFLGNLVPKSLYWYEVKEPHCLVRFEGSRGGPGSPTTILELQSYEAGG
jgi:hypothetical protein